MPDMKTLGKIDAQLEDLQKTQAEGMPPDERLLDQLKTHAKQYRELAEHHRRELQRCERIITACDAGIEHLAVPRDMPSEKAYPHPRDF